MPDTKNPEHSTAISSDEKGGELKRREVSRDSTTRSPASKRPCIPINTPGDEMQDSVDSIASGDRDDKQAIMKLKSTSRPPPPILLKTESQWRKFAYGDLRDIRHSNIKQLWASLRRDTTGLVKEWMPERYVREDLSEESRKQISSWASNAKEHIENEQKDHPKALFEGWIFHLLHENLFSLDCHEKWSSPDWAMFGQLQRIFSNHAENSGDAGSPFNIRFHNWRHTSSGMLFDMHKDAWHTEPGRLYNILAEHLGPLFLSKPRVRAPRQTSHKRLEWLVYRAIKLDALMIHSLISLTMKMRDPATGEVKDFPLVDRKLMIAQFANLGGSHVVDFIIEPQFTICGFEGLPPREDNWEDSEVYRSSLMISEGLGAGYATTHHEWVFCVAASQINGPAAGEDHDLPQPTENPEEA
ncbi:unnamed protein product [Clonostachys rosea f. rosea IK726]|uniref:Uncharacterized protein n=1 Tax=Clonostachys rosea f. rosea IK726 TaxID=1349383 RepID=A0ACA9THJ8_BIOOC|nr:unnamed protein product [Clonostachys rosea f. rosea IK726]